MKAKEAREMALLVNTDGDFKNILDKIEEAASEGKFYTYVFTNLPIEGMLVKLGYDVEMQGSLKGLNQYSISW